MLAYADAYQPSPPAYVPVRPGGGATSGAKVMVLDVARTLVEATPGARILLAEGSVLRCCYDQVAATTRIDAARLVRALAFAFEHGEAKLTLEGDGDPIEADCIAVGDGGASRGRIVMILKPMLENRRQRIFEAEAKFGLTRAESRLLTVLFEGCSVPEAADRLGVARSTARTHLQRVFDKTGARRQGDLLRLVSLA